MSKIITTSQVQKNIGSLSQYVIKDFIIITNRGNASMVCLPYFEDNDDIIQEYMENYEMQKNKKDLQKQYRDSLDSGLSDLTI